MNSPIGWVGGKRLLAPTITNLLLEHTCYCEVFGGAGWVLFGKAPSQVECYNDLNEDLVNLFRQIRENPEKFFEKLYFLFASRAEYFAFQKARQEGRFASDLDRAVAFYYEVKNTFGNVLGKGWALSRKSPPPWNPDLKTLCEVRERLKRVYIENLPYDRLIKVWDSPETVFYLDPPYVGTEEFYTCRFTDEDHRRLASILAAIQGRFVLSYEVHEVVRKLYPADRFSVLETCPIRRSLNSKGGKCKEAPELLIGNYDLEAALATGGNPGQADLFSWTITEG